MNRGLLTTFAVLSLLSLALAACGGASEPPPTPTQAPTLAPAPTSTPEPSPTPPPSGRIKEEQADGSTLFTDYDGGYTVTFPDGWIVVITDKESIEGLMNQVPPQTEGIEDLMNMLEQQDEEIVRVFAFNFAAQTDMFTPNMNISHTANALLADFGLSDILEATAQQVPAMIPGATLQNQRVSKAVSGLEFGYLDLSWAMQDASGAPLPLKQQMVIFKSGEGATTITLSVAADSRTDLSDALDSVTESVTLMD